MAKFLTQAVLKLIKLLLGIKSTIDGNETNELGVTSTILPADRYSESCFSEDCNFSATQILQNMDENVDPCEDFYSFACGSFINKTRIPDDKKSVDIFSTLEDELQSQIKSLLEEPITLNEPSYFVQAKTLYQACMNTTVIEARGIKPLLDMLHRLGGWPVLDGKDWDENSFSWEQSVYRFRKAGYSVDYFLKLTISADDKNSTLKRIELNTPNTGLEEIYFRPELFSAYYLYMVEIATLLGSERRRAETELRESLSFQIQLALIAWPVEKQTNLSGLYNPMSIAELQAKFPMINWLDYINNLLGPKALVGPNEIINVCVPEYISNLQNFLTKTSKRAQANYAMWRVVASSVKYLTDELRQKQLAFLKKQTGRTAIKSRWEECTHVTAGSMPIAVGALYAKKHFSKNSKNSVLEMVNSIRKQFRKTLLAVDWMDELTRKEALEKLDSMTSYIGYPNEILDSDKVSKYYHGLKLSPDKYLESVMNTTFISLEDQITKLREPSSNTDWVIFGNTAVVNGFYKTFLNCIYFPVGILQGAFFSANRPAYLNFGAIGFMIAHEIIHGFDDQGSQIDKNGNVVNWWQQSTKLKYLEKAQCIIDQYSNYTVGEVGLKLSGDYTESENIADCGGIKHAYYAYEAWTQKHGKEQKLPGLEKYTPKQLFWLSAANTWCTVYRDETLKLDIKTQAHVPGRYRVLGPMSNMEEFSKDFKCSVGSPMNPENKCKIW